MITEAEDTDRQRDKVYFESLLAAYDQSSAFIRHFDTVGNSAFTVYLVFLAGLVAGYTQNIINTLVFSFALAITSLYFALYTARLQKNYDIHYDSLIEMEQEMLKLSGRESAIDDHQLLPTLHMRTSMPEQFSFAQMQVRLFGKISYFSLKMLFYFLVSTLSIAGALLGVFGG